MNEIEKNSKLLADISELHTYILHSEKKENKSSEWSQNGFYRTHRMLSDMLMSLSDRDARDILIKQYVKEGLSLNVRSMYATAAINGDETYAQQLMEMFQQGNNFYYKKVATEGYRRDPIKWDEGCREDALEYRKEDYMIALARAKKSDYCKINGKIINTEEYKRALKPIIDVLDADDLDKEKFETLLNESCKGEAGDRYAVIISEDEYNSVIQTGEKRKTDIYMTTKDIRREQEIYELLGLIGKGGYSDSKLNQMISFLEDSESSLKLQARQMCVAQLAAGLTDEGKEKFLTAHPNLYGLAEARILTGKQLYRDAEPVSKGKDEQTNGLLKKSITALAKKFGFRKEEVKAASYQIQRDNEQRKIEGGTHEQY